MILKISLALSLIFSSTLFAQKADEFVAKVNGVSISKTEFEITLKQNQLYGAPVTKQKVLDDLIHRALGIQKARKGALDSDPTVKQKMEDVLFHAQISKDLEDQLKKIVVTDKEVEAYFKKFPEYRTAHILFRLPMNPKKEQMEAAQTQAMKVHQSLKKDPSLFPTLANKFSQTNIAPDGGDLGFQPAVSLAKTYFDAINGHPKDYITPPVRTPFGYHIIKIIDQKSYANIDKDLYKKIIYDTKRDQLHAKYFADLRKGADIQINKKALE